MEGGNFYDALLKSKDSESSYNSKSVSKWWL